MLFLSLVDCEEPVFPPGSVDQYEDPMQTAEFANLARNKKGGSMNRPVGGDFLAVENFNLGVRRDAEQLRRRLEAHRLNRSGSCGVQHGARVQPERR
jgi:hypothetical protein